MPTVKEAVLIGVIATLFLAIVFRTPLAPYVTGDQKVLGIL